MNITEKYRTPVIVRSTVEVERGFEVSTPEIEDPKKPDEPTEW